MLMRVGERRVEESCVMFVVDIYNIISSVL